MTGFLYPNEILLQWDLLIVIYPFITGLVAGAFIVSSLYHVFGLKKLKPVSRFSLVAALSFLLIAPLPLMAHLGRPERALEMFYSPNLNSAMSGFGYIWTFYTLLVLAEIWLVFRPDIVKFANNTDGLKKTIYTAMALGILEINEETEKIDHSLIKILAFIGIPSACLLHGYVGFIFGAIKANPWWSTPLMPVIFLMSAIVSGIALLIVMYMVVCKIRRVPIDYPCIHTMSVWLCGFLTVDVALEGLEVFSMLYTSEESWPIISQLITQKITVSYVYIQFLAGSVLPLFALASVVMATYSERLKSIVIPVAAMLVVIGVFAMRYNVVIGGQMLSKSLRGFSTFTPELFSESGVLVTAGFLMLPFLVFTMVSRLLPPWQDPVAQVVERRSLSWSTSFSRK